MSKNRVKPDPRLSREEFHEKFPPEVRWKSDNYSHLMEQPTLFYAVALILAFIGAGDGLNAVLAWVYVALRIAHSLVQASINIIPLRFALFAAASLVLLAMAVRAAFVLL